ncbi:uncharacterized protein FTOL_13419 [Fusarium torulosum]|uniref:Uncharacterized protein n=1 Tax=Fusarium torulosum TaxID=33205 RepID=A0AAE8MPC2_9HYPO|nr:uncharacterized protein FTOL_13419 [Fusarium torulosum]
MSIHHLAQTHCNTVQHATQQLEHPGLDTTSPQEERTVHRAVRRTRGRRVRPRRVRPRNPGKRFSMREAFVGGTALLQKAARLAEFDGISLDLCFWDLGCSSWVGMELRPSGAMSRNSREFEGGRATFRKWLRSLHDGITKYVEAYGVPCRLKCFDPFKEQWLVTIGAPDGWLMDSQDWERAVSTDMKWNTKPHSCLRSLNSVKVACPVKQDGKRNAYREVADPISRLVLKV